jgi:ribonuclease P protein component
LSVTTRSFAPYSFAFRNRLHRSSEYARFFEGSEVLRLRDGVVFRIRNSFGFFRLGFTIKSRTTAVRRNRFKRKVREVFRVFPQRVGEFDYNVVIPSRARMGLELENRLLQELRDALSSGNPGFIAARANTVRRKG